MLELKRLAQIGALLAVCTRAFAMGQAMSAPGSSDVDAQFSGIHSVLTEDADSQLAVTEPEFNYPAHATLASVDSAPKEATGAAMLDRHNAKAAERLESLKPQVEPILAHEAIPAALAAVILVESGGNPMALSPKGARGLWQLMPATARRYGLRVDDQRDERLDLEKSTAGAARYLHDLYLQFGSWPLALAAYNTGEQNVQRAIERSNSRDFATLSFLGFLPAETRSYVPAVLAAMGPGHGFTGAVSNRPAVSLAVYAMADQEEAK